MEIQGKVIAVLPERSGVSARGEWKSQTYVIETQEQYHKKMAFDVFGADRLAQFNIHSGEEILVSFDIDAHEYQGRWFNSIRAWNVTKVSQQAMASSANAAGVANPTNQQNLFPPEQQSAQQQAQQRGNSDDLPF
nr:MAG TPA: Single-stranded DNA-binding protein, BARTONELLA HENSELAE, SINGLE-STRAND BINDING.1A [Caudoviricetes sp.]